MNNHILTPFLNRAGDSFDPSGWFHLVPLGQFRISRDEKEGQKTIKKFYTQVVDEIAADRIVAAFANRLAANPDFKLLIDFEHFSHDEGKSTEAACWITHMEKRADGVWAKGEWSDVGEAAIRNRRYRYLSPVWFQRQTEKISETHFRPVEVNDAGLTNKPNLGAALTPFWNRAGDEPFNGREAADTQPEQKNKMKEQLIALLGLPAEADEAAVLAAVQALKDTSEKAAGEAAPLKNRLSALETAHKALLGDAVAKELDANKDVIPEGQQGAWKNRLESDFTGTASLLRGLKRPESAKTPVHKAGAAAAAASKKTAGGEDDEHPFLNRVQEIMTADKCTEAQAIDKAAATSPALYRDYAEAAVAGRPRE